VSILSFSERYGYKKLRKTFQKEEMSDSLRNRLWNVFSNDFLYFIEADFRNNGKYYTDKIIDNYFKISLENFTFYINCKKYELNNTFNSDLDKLYAYTSALEGIKHSIMEEKDIYIFDARFMLVICSAFVNYLLAKNVNE